jgi:hypothetical protein
MHDLFQALSSGSIRVFQERHPVKVQDIKKGKIIVPVMRMADTVWKPSAS